MIWCINMLVSAVTSLSYVSKYFEEWIEAEALIIGRNVTVYYQNSSQSRRRLIISNIPDSTMEDFWGNDTDTFGVMNVTNDGDAGVIYFRFQKDFCCEKLVDNITAIKRDKNISGFRVAVGFRLSRTKVLRRGK